MLATAATTDPEPNTHQASGFFLCVYVYVMIRLLSSTVLPDMDSGPDHNSILAGACHSKGEFAVCVCFCMPMPASFAIRSSIFCLKPDIKFVSVSDKTS